MKSKEHIIAQALKQVPVSAAPTTPDEYWKWLEEYTIVCAGRTFAQVHPELPRALAGTVWGFASNDFIRTMEWQVANQKTIRRVMNRGAKRVGMRLSKRRTGYAVLEVISKKGEK